MLSDDLIDIAVEPFGGYCPAIVPANLPPGAANVAQDVMFPMAGVRTRGGLGTGVVFGGTAIPAGASINGLKTFLTSTGKRDLLIWDSLGDLFKEDPQGTLNLINSRPYQNLFCQSQTLFGREYQAFSNAAGGFDIPRQYDDTNWDRVSQVGPGAAPIASDASWALLSIYRVAVSGVIVATIAAPYPTIPGIAIGKLINFAGVAGDATLNGQFPITNVATDGLGHYTITAWGAFGSYLISSISRTGGVVTATIGQSAIGQTPNITVGEPIVVGGVEDATYNGAFMVASVSGNVITYNNAGPDSVSGGGTVYVQNFTAPVIVAWGTVGNDTAGLAVFGDQVTQFVAGATINIQGNTQGAFNTSFEISTTNPPLYVPPGQAAKFGAAANLTGVTLIFFTIVVNSGAGTGGIATATLPASAPPVSGTGGPAGNISQGLHQVSVSFITRQGFITQAAVPAIWNAQGGFGVNLADVALGPSNIQQRLLLFTPVISPPATTGSFYSLPNGSTALSDAAVMLIPDNLSTTATVDFSDAILISGFQADYLFSELELGESACMLPYNSRTVWLGERNKVPNFVNLTFDGGEQPAAPGYPMGWTPDPNLDAGGGGGIGLGDWGNGYLISGNSVTAVRGKIAQSAYQDYLGTPILQPNTSYSVRARVASLDLLTQGTLHINLSSASGAFTTVGLSVPAAQALLGKFTEFTAALTDAPFAIVPADLVLQVYADGTPPDGGTFVVDSIEPYPTLTPFNSSTARISRAFNPESFDSVTGQVQVRPGDGQTLRSGFPIRNSLYLAKDHYLGYVTDDGVNEPSSWAFTEVSATVGICGPNAVDWTEEWAVFAERSGFYICWGSDPVKVTPEIQEDVTNSGRISWASINWSAGTTIWVRIDKVRKMILIGAPVNGALTPNVVFMLDYRWLDSGEEIAASPFVTYSAFTGKMLGHGKGRRWAIWNIAANSMCFAERADGTAQPFFGGVGNGDVFWQQDVSIQGSDDGAAIASQYQTYALPSAMEEQQYQLRAHRKLFGYLKFRAIGSGLLSLAISTAQRSALLRGYTLSPNPAGDGERPVNLHGERFFITVSTAAVNSWFQLEKMIACVKKDSAALVRGVSA